MENGGGGVFDKRGEGIEHENLSDLAGNFGSNGDVGASGYNAQSSLRRRADIQRGERYLRVNPPLEIGERAPHSVRDLRASAISPLCV